MVATPSTSSQTKGVVRQVIGPVLDVEFPAGKLPKILNALRIEAKNPAGQDIALTAEVQQLLGDHRVRAGNEWHRRPCKRHGSNRYRRADICACRRSNFRENI